MVCMSDPFGGVLMSLNGILRFLNHSLRILNDGLGCLNVSQDYITLTIPARSGI